jgi:hypothetical protein
MSNTNTGGPAFPVPDIDGGKVCEGMTLRDYFAAKAIQGFAACSDVSWPHTAEMAALAYKWADAMLKAREA